MRLTEFVSVFLHRGFIDSLSLLPLACCVSLGGAARHALAV